MLKQAFLFLVTLSLLSACALSPQKVTLSPEVNVATAEYGQGRSINVMVEDNRDTEIIGVRGGVYSDTSTITAGGDYKTELAHAMANGLTQWGFVSHVGATSDAIQFTLSVDEITYLPPERSVAGKSKVDVAVSIKVLKGMKQYSGRYSASGEQGHATTPSEEKNAEHINRIIGLALEEVFADEGLVNFFQ